MIDKEFGRDFAMAAIPAGFALYGAGVAQSTNNPAAGAALAQFGEGLAQTFQKRWWKKEAEIFQQRYVQPYQQTAQQAMNKWEKEAQEIVSRKVDPEDEQTVTKQQRDYLKSRMNFVNAINSASNQLLMATTKYPTNPLVGQISDNLQGAYLNWADQLTSAMAEGAQLQERNLEMAVRRRELEALPTGEQAAELRRAQVGTEKARQASLFASAARDRALAQEAGLMGSDPRRALDAVMGTKVHEAAHKRTLGELRQLQQDGKLRGIVSQEDPYELERMAETIATRTATIDYMRSRDANLSEAEADFKMAQAGTLTASYSFIGQLQKRYGIPLYEAKRLLDENNWNLLDAIRQAEKEFPDEASKRDKQLEAREKEIKELRRKVEALEVALGVGPGNTTPKLKGEEARKARLKLRRLRAELHRKDPSLGDRLVNWVVESHKSNRERRQEQLQDARRLLKDVE